MFRSFLWKCVTSSVYICFGKDVNTCCYRERWCLLENENSDESNINLSKNISTSTCRHGGGHDINNMI